MKIKGIDTLEFGIYIEKYNEDFSNILAMLEEEKISSQNAMKNQIINLNGINFSVFPKGQGIYKYKIESKEFFICFASKKIKNSPPIYIRFYSNFLWEYGFIEAYNKFIEWFNMFETTEYSVKVSRADICLDIDEIEFYDKDREKFYSRSNKLEKMYVDSEHYNNKNFSGFVFGKGGSVSCRIYNKTFEIKKSNKKWFEDIWREYGWDGEKEVWRIEFQMRGKIIKELKIVTIYDLQEQMDKVWAYLTQNWLSIRIKSKDTNVTRYKVDKRWQSVQLADYNYLPTPAIRERIKKGDLENLLETCSGTLLSIASIRGEKNLNNSYLCLVDFLKKKNKAKNTTIEKEIQKRANRYIDSN